MYQNACEAQAAASRENPAHIANNHTVPGTYISPTLGLVKSFFLAGNDLSLPLSVPISFNTTIEATFYLDTLKHS